MAGSQPSEGSVFTFGQRLRSWIYRQLHSADGASASSPADSEVPPGSQPTSSEAPPSSLPVASETSTDQLPAHLGPIPAAFLCPLCGERLDGGAEETSVLLGELHLLALHPVQVALLLGVVPEDDQSAALSSGEGTTSGGGSEQAPAGPTEGEASGSRAAASGVEEKEEEKPEHPSDPVPETQSSRATSEPKATKSRRSGSSGPSKRSRKISRCYHASLACDKFPNCWQGPVCSLRHPDCPAGADCPHGDACAFEHPEKEKLCGLCGQRPNDMSGIPNRELLIRCPHLKVDECQSQKVHPSAGCPERHLLCGKVQGRDCGRGDCDRDHRALPYFCGPCLQLVQAWKERHFDKLNRRRGPKRVRSRSPMGRDGKATSSQARRRSQSPAKRARRRSPSPDRRSWTPWSRDSSQGAWGDRGGRRQTDRSPPRASPPGTGRMWTGSEPVVDRKSTGPPAACHHTSTPCRDFPQCFLGPVCSFRHRPCPAADCSGLCALDHADSPRHCTVCHKVPTRKTPWERLLMNCAHRKQSPCRERGAHSGDQCPFSHGICQARGGRVCGVSSCPYDHRARPYLCDKCQRQIGLEV